jgi:hypothetical protein
MYLGKHRTTSIGDVNGTGYMCRILHNWKSWRFEVEFSLLIFTSPRTLKASLKHKLHMRKNSWLHSLSQSLSNCRSCAETYYTRKFVAIPMYPEHRQNEH